MATDPTVVVLTGVLLLLSYFTANAPAGRTATKQYLFNAAVCSIAVALGVTQLDGRLENFYIFDTERLHALSLKAIDQHGNNTRAIVDTIVSDLRTDSSIAPYLSVGEEWVFNNAGGAMGGMYIIHASMLPSLISSHSTSR